MGFKITYFNDETEDVEADSYQDKGDWIDFTRFNDVGMGVQVLRVRANEVQRVEETE